jgi:hypothetical protein
MKFARAPILLAALLVVPTLAFAQQMASAPKLEMGVDLSLQYTKPSGEDAYFHFGAPVIIPETGIVNPVVLRLGFVPKGANSLELRFSGGVLSSSGSSGATYYDVAPGVNVLHRLSGKSADDNSYVTLGASADIFGRSGGGTSRTYFFVTFNAGVGLRRPWGAVAQRGEFYFAYTLKNNHAGTPNTFHVGLRLGVSLFH